MIARISRWAALLGGVVTLVIVLLISYDVGMRTLFNSPQMFVDELAGFLQVFVIFSGLAYTFVGGGHVRVDLLTSRMAPARRARLRLVTLCAGLVVVLIIAWVTSASVITAFDYGRVSTVELYPLWIPMALIPLGLLLLAVAMLAAIARQWRRMPARSAEPDEVALTEDAA